MQLPEDLAEAIEILFPEEAPRSTPVTAADFCDAAGLLGWWPEVRYLRVVSSVDASAYPTRPQSVPR